ncbi:methylenetetrahydrofolate reductase [Aestuariivirga sp.]|jgi:methylenetetrahydrofolate reductase (NADPH)|uniref:methylenetetrahydrofolate reductase n=1 Tax=Aestuariivirga sp. TaxID=2650926 RepID=UPI0037838DAF
MNAPLASHSLPPAEATSSFLGLASIEITPKQIEKLALLKDKLKPGSRVFIALIDAGDLAGQIEAARQLKASGFDPVPHVPARFVKDEADLQSRIKALAECGATSMLVLGGGAPEPIGQYDAAIQLLQTGVFQANGVKNIGLAGHPEGNPDITKIHGEAVLVKALKEKQAYLKANNLEGFIATQFLFEAEPVAEWAAMLRAEGIDLPIFVGVPGPATIKTLVKYAAMCGVGNSARFIRKQALNITKLLTVNTPDDFVAGLAQLHYGRPELGVAGPHLYPFGGFDKLFDWLAAVK